MDDTHICNIKHVVTDYILRYEFVIEYCFLLWILFPTVQTTPIKESLKQFASLSSHGTALKTVFQSLISSLVILFTLFLCHGFC